MFDAPTFSAEITTSVVQDLNALIIHCFARIVAETSFLDLAGNYCLLRALNLCGIHQNALSENIL
jgi:hypothetical protein